MKAYSELTTKGQKARLTRFANQRKKYNEVNGLFNLSVVVDDGESTVTDKQGVQYRVHKFFYVGAPAGAKNCEEQGIEGFVPFNETIFMTNKDGQETTGQKAVDKRIALLGKLTQKRANGKKTVRASIDYKITNLNGKVYRDVDNLRDREPKA